MRKVVCDTTPILSLLKIGHLDLLAALYKTLIVPNAVWQEIEAGKGKSFYTDLAALPWIEIRKVNQNARHFDLPFTGTLGVMLRAKKEGHLKEIKPLLELLREEGVWISDLVFQNVLALAGES